MGPMRSLSQPAQKIVPGTGSSIERWGRLRHLQMDDNSQQLNRLLAVADMRVLRLVHTATLGTHSRLAPGRTLATYRKALFRTIKRRDLVESALRYLVVENAREFIPRSQWQLRNLTGVGYPVLHHQHFLFGQYFINENFIPTQGAICLFLPCHKVKPYSFSPTIYAVRCALESRQLLTSVNMVFA